VRCIRLVICLMPFYRVAIKVECHVSFGLREHIATVLRRWGIVTTILMVSVLIAGTVAFLSSKAYVADSRILILGSSQVERATNTSFNETSGRSSPQEQVLTQVAIVKSPLLAERLALELGPERVVDEMRWRWDGVREIPGNLKDELILAMDGWPPAGNILSAVGIRIPVPGSHKPSLGKARDLIMDGLVVKSITKTDIFVIGFEAPDPVFAAEVVNGMVKIYVEHVVALNSPSGTAEIAQKEAQRLDTDLKRAEETLSAFTAENNIYLIERQKSLLLERLAQIRKELSASQSAALEASQRIESIERRISDLPSDGSVSVTSRPNPVVDRLRERLSQLQTEILRFVPGSSSEQRIRVEIDSILSQLNNASVVVEGSKTTGENTLFQQFQSTLALELADRQAQIVRKEFLARQLLTAEEELRRLDYHERQYRVLQRNAEAKEQAYRYAVQKREETAITELLSEASLAQVVQVEQATPPGDPTSPRRGLLLGMGAIVGLMFGVGTAYVLEFNRRTMSTPRETELALGLRVLAAIDRAGLLVKHSQKNEIEYRRFASWLTTRLGGQKTVPLVICNAHRNEAPSDVIDEIANALHKQGENVLKIKIDTHAEDKPWVEIPILPAADDTPALHVAFVKARPWEIPEQSDIVLKRIGNAYSYVLISTPDMEVFPEQLQIAKSVGSVVMLIEADRTRVRAASEQIAQIRDVGAEVIGAVLNNRRSKTSSWAFSWMANARRKSS